MWRHITFENSVQLNITYPQKSWNLSTSITSWSLPPGKDSVALLMIFSHTFKMFLCFLSIFLQPKRKWKSLEFIAIHYNDVIMGTIASQITNLPIVYSTVYSDADQRKHQSSASLAFVRGIHRGPVNFPYKWPVTRKLFPFDDVIMTEVCSNGSNLPQISIRWGYGLWSAWRQAIKWNNVDRIRRLINASPSPNGLKVVIPMPI